MKTLLKDIVRYQNKNRDRREAGVYVAEGLRLCREMPLEDVLNLVLSESFQKAQKAFSDEISARILKSGGTVDTVPDTAFERISDTAAPQGVLAVLKRKERTEEEVLKAAPSGLFVFLEDLRDPGNLGTVFRSAEAAGADGLILSANSVDPTNPKVIRASMGSFFRVPYAVTKDLTGVIRRFRDAGGTVLAAHLAGSVPYDEASYRGLSAILIGSEAEGLTEEAAEASSYRIRIPMAGRVESLNAAMAASILLFEAERQRRVK